MFMPKDEICNLRAFKYSIYNKMITFNGMKKYAKKFNVGQYTRNFHSNLRDLAISDLVWPSWSPVWEVAICCSLQEGFVSHK